MIDRQEHLPAERCLQHGYLQMIVHQNKQKQFKHAVYQWKQLSQLYVQSSGTKQVGKGPSSISMLGGMGTYIKRNYNEVK